MASWTLDGAYDAYPRIEEEFENDLDASLDPRGPDVLFDFVAGFDLVPGCVAVDVGCGEGTHALSLAGRFGFAVTGVDPVPRHVEVAREAAGPDGPTFVLGTAESLPIPDASVDLVWCRDVLVHVADLPSVYTEFRRVLRPGGRALVYQMYGTDLLEEREAAFLWDTMGVVAQAADPARTDAAIAAAGLRIDECVALTSEWGEHAQEHGGTVGRKLPRTGVHIGQPATRSSPAVATALQASPQVTDDHVAAVPPFIADRLHDDPGPDSWGRRRGRGGRFGLFGGSRSAGRVVG